MMFAELKHLTSQRQDHNLRGHGTFSVCFPGEMNFCALEAGKRLLAGLIIKNCIEIFGQRDFETGGRKFSNANLVFFGTTYFFFNLSLSENKRKIGSSHLIRNRKKQVKILRFRQILK